MNIKTRFRNYTINQFCLQFPNNILCEKSIFKYMIPNEITIL